jgi:response regulator of citrate/malate metabolism
MTNRSHGNTAEATKERILGITEHRWIANLESIARHADISRLTAEKYLTQLIDEGKVREMRVGNNRLFVRESGDDS